MRLFDRTTEHELLERSAFLEELGVWLDAADRRDGGGLVLVAGEAGVGKTALLRRFCATHAERARILLGASEGIQTARALGPLVIIAGSVSDDEARETYPEGWKAPKPYIRIVPQPS